MLSFNSYEDEGRSTCVLLHLQHSCEMLLKAVLSQKKVRIFDKNNGKSIGFEKCLNLCREHGLSEADAGVMRSIDRLRDAEQHWFVELSEEILYLETRALITTFDSYLKLAFDDDLSSHIPARVLPVSTMPPGDFEFLVDREYQLIADLLRPGKRQRDEARARIRALLAMEALVSESAEVSEKDVDRIEKGIRDGKGFGDAFPRLLTVNTTISGEGITLKVVHGKKDGAPVRYVGGDDVSEAAAVREIDLSKKYHLRASSLAKKLKMSEPRCKALRVELDIDGDKNCAHLFQSLSSKWFGYSDNALIKMKGALAAGIDMEQVWERHRPRAQRGRHRRHFFAAPAAGALEEV